MVVVVGGGGGVSASDSFCCAAALCWTAAVEGDLPPEGWVFLGATW